MGKETARDKVALIPIGPTVALRSRENPRPPQNRQSFSSTLSGACAAEMSTGVGHHDEMSTT